MNITITSIDNKVRRFECTTCNKKFTTKHCMQTHMKNICKNNTYDITKLKNQVDNLQKIVLENKIKNINENKIKNINENKIQSINENKIKNCNYINII